MTPSSVGETVQTQRVVALNLLSAHLALECLHDDKYGRGQRNRYDPVRQVPHARRGQEQVTPRILLNDLSLYINFVKN